MLAVLCRGWLISSERERERERERGGGGGGGEGERERERGERRGMQKEGDVDVECMLIERCFTTYAHAFLVQWVESWTMLSHPSSLSH